MLGCVPHQIRGALASFSNLLLTAPAYERCTACSPCVLQALDGEKMGFLNRVWNEPSYLEELTGLAKMREEAEAMMEGLEIADDIDSDDW